MNRIKSLAPALLSAALCVAAPLTAQAQSNVSLYGMIDLAAGQFQNAGDSKTSKVESGGMSTSYFGFQGTEDLGDGLKAMFKLEGFLRNDTGASGRFNGDTMFARNSYVGLQGKLGGVMVGRNTTPLFVSTLIFNALGDSFGYSPNIRQLFIPTTGLAFFGDTGWNNSVAYSSPNFGGLSFNLLGNVSEGAAGATGNNIGGNVLYFAGPLAATAAFQQVKNGAFGTPAGFKSQDTWQLGASYDLSVAKLYGQYSNVKTSATADTETRLYGVGVAVPVGLGKVLAQWGDARAYFGSKEVVNKTLSLAYDHNLSKNTDIYAVVMNDKLTAKTAGNTLAAGIRLKF